MIRSEPVVFDFDGERTPIPWLVDGVLERGTVTVLSGDTGGGKSWLSLALTVAVLGGGQWLGRPSRTGRVLYLDAEMPRRMSEDRLRALGLTAPLAERLAFHVWPDVTLGEPESDRWLVDQTKAHGADLVVLDSATALSGVDLNSNRAVGDLFRTALRPVAAAGAAVVVLHHERKQGYTRDASQSVMGARQWVGQADLVVGVQAGGKLADVTAADGATEQTYPLRLEWVKLRDGVPDVATRLEVRSRQGGDQRLAWASLDSLGNAAAVPTGEAQLAAEIVALLGDGAERRRGEIAEALGRDTKDGTLTRALRFAVASGRVLNSRRGVYVIAP